MDDLRIDHRLTIPAYSLEERFIRSPGPGGQNVNKVATAVQLRFDARGCGVLSARALRRALELAGQRATLDGEIIIESSKTRSQARNRDHARNRLRDLLLEATEPPPKPRRPTRPTRGSVERRLAAKSRRADVKSKRGRPTSAD